MSSVSGAPGNNEFNKGRGSLTQRRQNRHSCDPMALRERWTGGRSPIDGGCSSTWGVRKDDAGDERSSPIRLTGSGLD